MEVLNRMDTSLLMEQVILPQVRIKTDCAGGSGTIVYSKNGSTYVLTCHHVVKEAITVKTEWAPPPIGRDVKREMRKPVIVEFFDYESVPFGHKPLTYSVEGDVVAYDKNHDMALVKLRMKKDYQYVAKLLDVKDEEKIRIGTSVCAVGCALLHDPIVTRGMITHMGDEIDYKDYWMSNASIVFGNSGGAVFLEPSEEGTASYFFIGIPSRVDIAGWGSPITHCGYFSPMHRVVQFLEEKMYDFIVDSEVTEAECEKKRRIAEDAEKRKFSMMMPSNEMDTIDKCRPSRPMPPDDDEDEEDEDDEDKSSMTDEEKIYGRKIARMINTSEESIYSRLEKR